MCAKKSEENGKADGGKIRRCVGGRMEPVTGGPVRVLVVDDSWIDSKGLILAQSVSRWTSASIRRICS